MFLCLVSQLMLNLIFLVREHVCIITCYTFPFFYVFAIYVAIFPYITRAACTDGSVLPLTIASSSHETIYNTTNGCRWYLSGSDAIITHTEHLQLPIMQQGVENSMGNNFLVCVLALYY